MPPAVSTVSIVIPCFNAGLHLDETVRSALAQTHSAIEVVIVDDGSSDRATLDLLGRCPWPKTRVLHKQNGGPASARNLAIAESSGRYILPLDADDLIEPTYVEKAVAVLDAEPDVGIVYCKAMKFGAENGPWSLPAYTTREIVIDNVIFVTSLFRREDWESVGGFSESLTLGVEDYDFWVKLISRGRAVRQLDEYLFRYRVGHASRTTGFNKDRGAMVKTYSEIFRGNQEFYGKHVEYLFEHRFALYDQIDHFRARYGDFDSMVERHPGLLWLLRRAYRVFNRLRALGRALLE